MIESEGVFYMITIKDIAKLAGVSPSTVSRVISGHPRISTETSLKVKQIMKELNYHPNMMAKSLVSKTTQTLELCRLSCGGAFSKLFLWRVVARHYYPRDS